MTQKNVTDKMRLLKKWILSKEKEDIRRKLIKEITADLLTAHPFYEDFFSDIKIKGMVNLGFSATRLRLVTNKILLDYFNGLTKIPFANHDSSKWEEIDNLMNPLIHINTEFISSKDFIDHLIKKEITGDEFITIGNSTIPYSYKAIQLHIDRIKAFPINVKDIADIQANFLEYKEMQLGSIPQNIPNKLPEIKVEEKTDPLDDPKAEVIKTKANILKNRLIEYGFFDMEIIQSLNINQQDKLIFKLAENKVPYRIAMLNHIGFIEYVRINHCHKEIELYRIIAKILETYDRAVSGNLNVLKQIPSDNLLKFTSHKFVDQVKLDLKKIWDYV